MILVVGGTGYLGRELVQLLVARGERVRVLARDPNKADLPDGVERVAGDVRDGAAVARALEGVRAVVSAMHGFVGKGVDPASVDRDGNATLIAAAKHVERFVLVSVHGASADHPMDLFRMKHAAEESVRASGIPFTIVRPTAFMETWIGIVGKPLVDKGKTMLFGRGENRINFVSAYDVARVIDRVLADPAAAGTTVDVAGPENVSFTGFVETVANVAGKEPKTSHVPRAAMHCMALLTRPFAPGLSRMIHAGIVMDTVDMTAKPSPDAPTTLADAVRRAI